jgi:SAM-dependent methyltransferase
MVILYEILKNILIKFPLVKSLAKRKHKTGVNNSKDGINTIYNLYNKYTDLAGKDVIELGPGHTYGVACKIKEAGARSVVIIDIEKNIPDDVLEKNSFLNYILYEGNEMPVGHESYDVVLSYTVYEHLRNPLMTIKETYRILREGGVAVHLIDLGDHLYYGNNNNPDKIFNCLRYSERVWNMMSYNRSIYVNRLRQSEWIKLHEDAGFEILLVKTGYNDHIKKLFEKGEHQYLNRIKPEDRFISSILLVAKKQKL